MTPPTSQPDHSCDWQAYAKFLEKGLTADKFGGKRKSEKASRVGPRGPSADPEETRRKRAAAAQTRAEAALQEQVVEHPVPDDERICAACGGFSVQYAGFSHAMDNPLEVWPMVITKALAKTLGSFAALAECGLQDILELLTAGACQITPLLRAKGHSAVMHVVHEAFSKGLAGVVHRGALDPAQQLCESALQLRRGIVPGCVYMVRGIKGNFVRLVCPASGLRHRFTSERLPRALHLLARAPALAVRQGKTAAHARYPIRSPKGKLFPLRPPEPANQTLVSRAGEPRRKLRPLSRGRWRRCCR